MAASASKSSLSDRIAAELKAHEQSKKESASRLAKSEHDREERMQRFLALCDSLRSVWGPRIEEFAAQLGEKISVEPKIEPTRREARIAFMTNLANITLSLSASTNDDVNALILDYDLLILPMFFKYDRHARLEVPLDQVDKDAIGKWIDDRLVSAVKAYLTVQDNEFYISRAMTEDPVTRRRFLRDDAVGSINHKGRTHYFETNASMQQYKKDNNITN